MSVGFRILGMCRGGSPGVECGVWAHGAGAARVLRAYVHIRVSHLSSRASH